ncbi:MAG: lytic murein transglycosylase [Rickettsiales bacterium]|nr:MAG: lytic murein transglycosylase [Rickettsiales bacterium]
MLIKKILFLFFFFCVFVSATDNRVFSEEVEQRYSQEDFENWLEDFKKYALTQGIKQEILDEAFKDAKFDHKIIELDKKQPEHKKTFLEYYSDAITKNRIEGGRKQIAKYNHILKKAEEKYGVSKYIIVAFWDLETHFGKAIGKRNILVSLANMGYDNRRRAFFIKELINALKIVQAGHVKIKDFKGSWAGAFGNFQFMPSTFLGYAVDGDGDKKIDLYNNPYDAIFSAGNFLKKIGWKKDLKWGIPIYFDKNNQELLDLLQSREWVNRDVFVKAGVKTLNKKPLKRSAKKIKAKLVAPMGLEGPIFLVYDNYNVIMGWNRATSYALNVGLISDAYQDGKILFKK